MRTGTCHFVDMQAAVAYYARQGFSIEDVRYKRSAGDFKIGKPSLKVGQRLSIIPGEGRYQIEDAEPTYTRADKIREELQNDPTAYD